MEHELARRERLDYFGLWDACYKLVSIRGLKGMYAEVSDHRYSYSMGIGHAWSVKVPYDSLAPLAERPYTRDTEQTKHSHPEQYRQHWKGGTAYNYGMYGVNYPVPCTIEHAVTLNQYSDDMLAIDAANGWSFFGM